MSILAANDLKSGYSSPLSLTSPLLENIQHMAFHPDVPPVFKLASLALLSAHNKEWNTCRNQSEKLFDLVRIKALTKDEIDFALPAFLLCGQMDLLSRIISIKKELDVWVSFGISKYLSESEMSIIEFSLLENHNISVDISRYIFKSQDPIMYARRIIYLLPLIADFHGRRDSHAKHIEVDISDFGTDNIPSFSGKTIDNLIPDVIFLNEKGYSDFNLEFTSKSRPWLERKDLVFWRGSTTGIAGRWQELQRVRLCQWARSKSDLRFDISIVGIVQRSNDETEELLNSGLVGNYEPASNLFDYKYHIDIDGNTNSWPGLFIKLLSGSPVFKVASEGGFKQWYYDKLVPWHNYIPIKSDLSDIDEVIEKAFLNPEMSAEIGANGAKLASELTYFEEMRNASKVMNKFATDRPRMRKWW